MNFNQLNWENMELLFEQGISENEEIRNRLIEGNLGLVYHIVKRFQKEGIEKDDLIQVGAIGLMKAVDTFNVNKNFKFATYASTCIMNEILMFLRKNRNKVFCLSLEQPILKNDVDHLTLKDTLYVSDQDLFERIELECNRRSVRVALSSLSPMEQEIILLHFGFYQDRCYNQSEIAERLQISQSYVSRIIKKCLEKLKKRILLLESYGNIYHRVDRSSKDKKQRTKNMFYYSRN